MKTRIIFALFAALMLSATSADAQILQGIKNKVKQKINEKVNQKVDKAIDQAADAVFDGKKPDNAEPAEKPGAGGAGTPTAQAEDPVKDPTTAYAKSDFVPGDEIFFEDLVIGEQVGEFPSKWDLVDGNCEISVLNGQTVISLPPANKEYGGDGGTICPLMKNAKNYLPTEYTIEFDYFLYNDFDQNNDIELLLKTEEDNTVVGNAILSVNSENKNGHGYFRYQKPGGDNVDIEYTCSVIPNAWNHFALSFNKRATKVYVNGARIASAPNCIQANYVELYSVPKYLGNGVTTVNGTQFKDFRFAKGAVPLYDRLTSTGKIITYAITFDTGKSTIKPESMTEINRIKELMTQQTDLKFEIQGHCDNTGSAATNDKLSQERANAIMAKLVELGIGADRLSAVGKGSKEPIADNSTDEGKAKNRRVEFVKK